MASYYNILKAIFYLLKRDYKRVLACRCNFGFLGKQNLTTTKNAQQHTWFGEILKPTLIVPTPKIKEFRGVRVLGVWGFGSLGFGV